MRFPTFSRGTGAPPAEPVVPPCVALCVDDDWTTDCRKGDQVFFFFCWFLGGITSFQATTSSPGSCGSCSGSWFQGLGATLRGSLSSMSEHVSRPPSLLVVGRELVGFFAGFFWDEEQSNPLIGGLSPSVGR